MVIGGVLALVMGFREVMQNRQGKLHPSPETQKPSRCDDASAGNSQDLVINSQK